MITGLSHINLLVPPGTLPLANTFYSETLGLRPRPVPAHRVHDLAWFEIGDSGQEVHIAPDYNGSNGSGSGETHEAEVGWRKQ
jgi:catechol 2,3-dioxygenase-like lactoylglutathione lyase family enzyme